MKTEEFLEQIKHVGQYSVKNTFHLLRDCIRYSGEGLYLEFGVYSGNSINFASSIKNDLYFYGFDSFEGLPEPWREGYPQGFFSMAGNMPKVNENVRLIKGWFSETLPVFLNENSQDLAFAHIDCDLYSSTKFVLDELARRIKPGTIILFDEFYNYPGWDTDTGFADGEKSGKGAGEFRAWFEFLEKNPNIEFEWIGYNIDHEQVAIRITSV